MIPLSLYSHNSYYHLLWEEKIKVRFFILGIIWGVLAISCSREPLKTGSSANVKTQKTGLWGLVFNLGGHVISPAFNRLEKETKALEDTISKQCQDPSQFDRELLKQSFLKAMRSYHFTESFQIGLITRNGYELKEQIYSWPQSNPYSIDVEIATKQERATYQYKGMTTSVGFPALEYLIYEETLTNQCRNCGATLLENWNQLSRHEKIKSRCHYMKFVSSRLTRNVQKLQKAWEPVDGDITLSQVYREDFKLLKEFATQLTHGIIFFDREMKHSRLGIPSGINDDLCGFDSCPERSEHLNSKDSIYSLLHSTKGLLAIFTGDAIDDGNKSGGYGFEEWLLEKGHRKFVHKFKESILNFIGNLEKLKDQTNIELLAKDVEYEECQTTTSGHRAVEICALYKDLERIVDLYKTDFLLAADFGRPRDQGGDTD